MRKPHPKCLNHFSHARNAGILHCHLWLDERQPAPYMAGLLTDYEPGFHHSHFQTQSGVTGVNTVRICYPLKQSSDHDREGKFILRHVPGLKNTPHIFTHKPWRLNGLSKHYQKLFVDDEHAL
jgi:deoxyribodipyrimidine photo-lyase